MAHADIRPQGRNRSAAALGRRINDWWHDRPFRWQILFAIALLTLLASLVSGVFAVFDARERAGVETRSNIELWSSHIMARAREIKGASDLQDFAAHLATEMANVRHVSVDVYDAAHNPIVSSTRDGAESPADEEAPDWFIRLVQPDIGTRSFSIGSNGQRLGTVVITGVPDDEIAEAWDLLKLMAMLWLGTIALMMVGLYFILNLILDPLAKLGRGLHDLEGGDYAIRLAMPRVRELETIAASFNTLAIALEEANEENSSLYRQLIAVQEEERREISRDLHDEFGPCLFGIMAGTTAVAHHAKALPEEQATPILACVEEIVQVSRHLKDLNRALLNRLRPIALGRQTIKELISELIGTFRRRHTGVGFELEIQDLPTSFGEDIDLTIYRCVQEAVTNAIRHGRPQRVKIDVSTTGQADKLVAKAVIDDDGRGMSQTASFGYGLSSMRERVQSLDGSLNIAPKDPKGTVLTVTVPLSDLETQDVQQNASQ